MLLVSCSDEDVDNSDGSSEDDSLRFYLREYSRHIDSFPDSAFVAAGEALRLSHETEPGQSTMFDIFYALGRSAEKTGQYDIAIAYFYKAIEFTKGVDISLLATAYNHIGQIAFRQGKYNIAMEYFPKALEIRIAQKDIEGQASSYKNIGSVYQVEWKYKEAEEHYLRSLQNYMEIGSIEGQAACYNNLGGLYTDQGVYDRALEYYHKSEILYRQTNSPDILVPMYNMGLTYIDMGEIEKAGRYYRETLGIARKWPENKRLLAEAYYSLGDYMNIIQKPDSALFYFGKSIEIAERSGLEEMQARALINRSRTYSGLLRFNDAIPDYESAAFISEELNYNAQEKTKAFTQMYMQYEAKVFQKQQMQRNRMLRGFVIVLTFGILLICMIAFLLYRNNVQKKKANAKLSEQWDKIVQQNKEITDGINSASLVQRAVLPPLEYINQILPDNFILYRPFDIVSGDFYWMTQKGQYTIVVAADCTGHGVSGAVVSMLGISSLNKIVGETEIPHSDVILNKLREDIIRLLNPEGSTSHVRNGMDIALVIIDQARQEIRFSGAKNPLYLIREHELTEIKADKMTIGVDERQDQPFTERYISYRRGDMIYLFSDGYVDQFDSVDQEKFKTKRFKSLLTLVSGEDLEKQLQLLDDTHLNWRGNNHQTDDILVIGIKL
jgi:serine phosphatase RsbU (regulator of sigma subunit)/Tfp pilus assembly protein PilF